MGIKIVNQTNEQECGVCALTALHNHYYNESVSKEQVLNQSNISDGGMTIFDFEALGSKLGLSCESYEVTYDEFLNLKINGYFVLLLSTGLNNNHYVIARKKKKWIEIYDSCSHEPKNLKYKELKKIFLNVLILIKKEPNKAFSKIFGKAQTLLMFDLKFVLLNLLLSIIILATSVACASFLNYVIDMAISKSSVNNLITICFIFILFYFANDVFLYVSNLYMSRHVKNYFILFTNKILSLTETKKLSFLTKVDKNWIFKVDECVYNISNFCIVEINRFITSIIFCAVCICIVGVIQYYLLIFVVAYAVIELIFFLFAYRKKKEVFINIIRSENNNNQLYKQLITSLSNELWLTKRKATITNIKNNYSEIYKNYADTILFKSNSDLFKSLLKSFCEICVVGLMSYLIIRTDKLSIGQLTFVISAFGLLKNSTSDLFHYWLAKVEFDIYWQVYKDLTTVDNISTVKQFVLPDKIKNITFRMEDKAVTISTENKMNKINVPIMGLLRNEYKIFINNQKTIVDKQLLDSFIILDQNVSINNRLLIQQIELDPQTYSQYLRYFKIDLNNERFDFYQILIINFLMLLSEKNKIIFIDDVLGFIKKNDMVVIKQILNKVNKRNTVFVVGKEEND